VAALPYGSIAVTVAENAEPAETAAGAVTASVAAPAGETEMV
jgi:hypothetical protein